MFCPPGGATGRSHVILQDYSKCALREVLAGSNRQYKAGLRTLQFCQRPPLECRRINTVKRNLMTTIDSKIEKLEEQLKQAKALKSQLAAKQKATTEKKAQADETRRKILIGAMFRQQPQSAEQKALLLAQLDGYLKKNGDRGLFNLPPLPKPAAVPTVPTVPVVPPAQQAEGT